MRLMVSSSSANEQLTSWINKGYQVLSWIRQDHDEKASAHAFNDETDNAPYYDAVNAWISDVGKCLLGIFPTELEYNQFMNPQAPVGLVGGDYKWGSLMKRFLDYINGLDRIRTESVARYTDLPISTRLYVEDIESFAKVRDVNHGAVADILNKGYLDMAENSIQLALEQILESPFHKLDWGGEYNDMYTSNVVVSGNRIATAFMLKGNGLKRKTLQIGNCGKNGDQLLRLLESPAKLFIVQFVGHVSEAVIKDIDGKVRQAIATGNDARYCIIDGQDTARLMRAYGKA